MSLAVDVTHRLGRFALDAKFTADRGLVALFGRSGSGKTSLINIIAGLIRPTRGYVAVDGTVLDDTSRNIHVARHQRRIGYVFQEGRLFPHLTVRQNLGYGRWFNRRSTASGPGLDDIVDLLGLGTLLERRPGRLSGGEKQRVAIGRALLSRPRILLMDEPLAALDETRKLEILPFIERLRDRTGVPIVYVTHAIPEVTRLADTVVLMTEGRVGAVGPTSQIMSRLDLFPMTGRAEGGAVIEATVVQHDPKYGLTELAARGGTWHLARLDAAPGERVRLRIRSRDVMLATERPEGLSALNVFAGIVTAIKVDGGPVAEIGLDCRGDTLTARITRLSLDRLAIRVGRPVFALVKSVALDRKAIGGRLDEPPGA